MLWFKFPPLSLKKRQEHKIKQSAEQHIIQSVKKYPHIHLTACQTFQKLRGQIKSSGVIICIARTSLVGISTISTKEKQRQFKRSSFTQNMCTMVKLVRYWTITYFPRNGNFFSSRIPNLSSASVSMQSLTFTGFASAEDKSQTE